MKKRKLFPFIILLFSLFCMNVEAKTLKTCTYEMTTEDMSTMVYKDLGHHAVTVTYEEGAITKKISVKAKVTYVQNNSTSKKLSISNWSDIESEFDSNTCFKYLLLYYKPGNVSDSGTSGHGATAEAVYLSNDYNKLKSIVSADSNRVLLREDGTNGTTANAAIIRGAGSADATEIEEAYKYVENAINKMLAYDFDVSSCQKENDCSECSTKLETYRNEASEFATKVLNYTLAGTISEEDSRTIRFNDVYSDVFDKLNTFRSDIHTCELTSDPGGSSGGGNSGGSAGGNSGGNSGVNTTFTHNCVSCGNGLLRDVPAQLPQFVRNLIKVLQAIVPIILIGLGIYDFIRAIISSDEKIMKEAQYRFIRRIIAAVLIFFIVVIVKFVFGLVPKDNGLGCIPCFITSESGCSAEYACPSFDVNTTNSGNSGN